MTLAIPRHLKPGLCLRYLNLVPRTRFANLILLSLDRGESCAPLRESAGRDLERAPELFQPLIEIFGATRKLSPPRRQALDECVERLELPARAPDVALGFRPALIGTPHLLMGTLREVTRIGHGALRDIERGARRVGLGVRCLTSRVAGAEVGAQLEQLGAAPQLSRARGASRKPHGAAAIEERGAPIDRPHLSQQ